MELPIRITAWRKAKGLSRQAVADAVGVSVTAVLYWETGETENPKQRHIEALVALFGITMAEFYGPVPATPTPDTGEHAA